MIKKTCKIEILFFSVTEKTSAVYSNVNNVIKAHLGSGVIL